jgi:hypothetical protein
MSANTPALSTIYQHTWTREKGLQVLGCPDTEQDGSEERCLDTPTLHQPKVLTVVNLSALWLASLAAGITYVQLGIESSSAMVAILQGVSTTAVCHMLQIPDPNIISADTYNAPPNFCPRYIHNGHHHLCNATRAALS